MPFYSRALFALLCFAAPLVFSKEPFKPNLGPDLATITVTCGDVTLLLRQVSQWTPGQFSYKGAPMTTPRSAYGTVFSFPNVGFIGTGHLENEPEVLKSLAFFVDDQPVAEPTAELKGKTFRFERKSRIRNFDLTNVIEIKNNCIYETSSFRTEEAQPLKLVYHFMHAWVPTVTDCLAGQDASPDKKIAGPLKDDPEVMRKFYINERVDWMAVHEPKSGQYGVSRLLQAPEKGGHISMVWNVSGTYRKYYLKCFEDKTVPSGFNGTWKMVTTFGSASPEQWESAARKTAEMLQR